MSYLSNLQPGDSACIGADSSKCRLGRRLLELGAVAGTRVECVANSPFGGLSAYLIRGAVIALRDDDADEIEVTNIMGSAAAGYRVGAVKN